MTVQQLYTIEPKPEGRFTLTLPDNSIPFGFMTKKEALAHVRSLIGDPDFQRATVTNRNDGGFNVLLPAKS
jgi:hypothetical protein